MCHLRTRGPNRSSLQARPVTPAQGAYSVDLAFQESSGRWCERDERGIIRRLRRDPSPRRAPKPHTATTMRPGPPSSLCDTRSGKGDPEWLLDAAHETHPGRCSARTSGTWEQSAPRRKTSRHLLAPLRSRGIASRPGPTTTRPTVDKVMQSFAIGEQGGSPSPGQCATRSELT